MNIKKKILVYPCGTEIALEIYKSVVNDKQYELYGGSPNYDHGRFVYKNHIDNLPFITDKSPKKEIIEFIEMIKDYHFDFIYPSMDGVITVFAKYRDLFKETIIAADYSTCKITRSKSKTYNKLKNVIRTPELFDEHCNKFPVFLKPDVGQGSVGTKKLNNKKELKEALNQNDKKYLVCEYLPGEELTVDCFTNSKGELVFAAPRKRNRIKNGISVNTCFIENNELVNYAYKINEKLNQKGAWFFQVKKDVNGVYTLLEASSRLAGSSSGTRYMGVNLALLTINEFNGITTNEVVINKYDNAVEVDRALNNVCKLSIDYSSVYVDFDDTVIFNDKLNTSLIKFLYQCVNNKKRIILLTKHKGDLNVLLKKFRIESLFDEIIVLKDNDNKYMYIKDVNSIYIDDSYGERKQINKMLNIPVFDIHNIECLIEEN